MELSDICRMMMCSVVAELEAARDALADHIQLAQSLAKMVNNLRSNISQQRQQVRNDRH